MTANPYFITAGLLVCSNIFMTFAWYAHLRNLSDKTWLVAAPVSWAIAFFEYLFQVPANLIGHQVMSAGLCLLGAVFFCSGANWPEKTALKLLWRRAGKHINTCVRMDDWVCWVTRQSR